jgi:LmbE family N-acetylglucosaminyl deacetylase
MSGNIMVVATHPDDETLGCGGTLLKLAHQGGTIHWVLVTAAHDPAYSSEQIATQAERVENVRQSYPFESLTWLRYPTTRLDTIPLDSLIVALHKCLAQVRPECVFIPNRSDVHSDHRVVFQALSAVLKPIYMRSLGVNRVLSCEIISETEAAPPSPECSFLPTVFVDIAQTFERKMEIMGLYGTEVHPEPLPRSPSAIRAQARFRGATIGVEYAEAFMLIREIE